MPIKHLNHLETTGLIHRAPSEPETDYLFRHSLVQEAAYKSLLRTDRIQLHRAVGETLERLYPDQLASRDLAPVLGQHFAEAGEDKRALHYFTQAGDSAADVYANAEAITHYQRALEITRDGQMATPEQLTHLYLQCGRAMELNTQHTQALQLYQALEQVGQQSARPSLELAALLAQATILVTVTPVYNSQQGHQVLDRALALAEELADREAEAKVLWNFMLLYIGDERPHEALEYGERSLTLARQYHFREQLAYTLNDLQYAYQSVGNLKQGRLALAEARELWREFNNLPMLTDNLSRSALIYFLSGEFDRALAVSNEALRISQAINNLWGQGFSRFLVGPIYQEQGQLGKALAAMTDLVHLSEEANLLGPFVLSIQVDLAWLYGYLGQVDRGVEMLQAALVTLRQEDMQRINFRPLIMAVLARLYILQGKLDQADAALAEASLAVTEEQPLSFAVVWVGLASGELALARQDYDRAITTLADFVERSRELGIQPFRAEAMHLLSQAYLTQNQRHEARQTLKAAKEQAESLGARRSLWHILFSLSQVEAQYGNFSGAEDLQAQARQIVEAMAESLTDPDLKTSFLRLPQVGVVLSSP